MGLITIILFVVLAGIAIFYLFELIALTGLWAKHRLPTLILFYFSFILGVIVTIISMGPNLFIFSVLIIPIFIFHALAGRRALLNDDGLDKYVNISAIIFLCAALIRTDNLFMGNGDQGIRYGWSVLVHAIGLRKNVNPQTWFWQDPLFVNIMLYTFILLLLSLLVLNIVLWKRITKSKEQLKIGS